MNVEVKLLNQVCTACCLPLFICVRASVCGRPQADRVVEPPVHMRTRGTGGPRRTGRAGRELRKRPGGLTRTSGRAGMWDGGVC